MTPRLLIAIGIFLALGLFLSDGLSAQTSEELSWMPIDSAEAQRVRIWIPVERVTGCNVSISIGTPKGIIVRHVFEGRLRKGYYNLYWDKKDDSGRYVPEGNYAVFMESCGVKRKRKVIAAYRPWEAETYLSVDTSADPPVADLLIEPDSLVVDLVLTTRTGVEIEPLASDTLLVAGTYRFPIQTTVPASAGLYLLELRVGGQPVSEVEFRKGAD